jgi:hypothetical protein
MIILKRYTEYRTPGSAHGNDRGRMPGASGIGSPDREKYVQKYQNLEKKVLKKATGYAIAKNKGYDKAIPKLAKWNDRLAKVRSLRPPEISTNKSWKVGAPRLLRTIPRTPASAVAQAGRVTKAIAGIKRQKSAGAAWLKASDSVKDKSPGVSAWDIMKNWTKMRGPTKLSVLAKEKRR